ncbi:MAG: cadherin repeat domain-containing protein [Saprospiraceae bacterium]|nr:cadherin repeat domain-containing protein [Saprospiraceae bacterium]
MNPLILLFFWCMPIGVLAINLSPQISLSHQMLPENEDLFFPIGKLSLATDTNWRDVQFSLTPEAPNSDNQFFRIRNDKLFSFYSFDYEVEPLYTVEIEAASLGSSNVLVNTFLIEIQDVKGKFDTDGFVDAELANKYPQVQKGDYIIFNQSIVGDIFKSAEKLAGITYPNKILIKGGRYNIIHLRLFQIKNQSVINRIAVTNFLGQVRAKNVRLYGGTHWRFTGQYDPVEGTGSPYFTGCQQNGSTIDFGFSRGNFGIWVVNEWISEIGESNLYIGDQASHFEIDHIEVSDGGFAGLLIKEENGTQDMDQVYLHHLYIHDIGSEGIYLGSTQRDPQHMFHDLIIENCVIVRTGSEALQTGQLGDGCLIRNNVLWGALDWIDPFQRFQDNTIQFTTREGGIRVENNVLLAGGEKFFNVSNQAKELPNRSLSPITVRNNLSWGCHGPIGVYQFKRTDGQTPWVWEKNYWGRFINDYDLVYPDHLSDTDQVFAIASERVSVQILDNIFDLSVKNIGGQYNNSTAIIKSLGNERKVIDQPVFVNALGVTGASDYMRWARWTSTIGTSNNFPSYRTNKGKPFTFHPGIQTCTGVEPSPDQTDYWVMLSWETPNGAISYYPPDDFRLETSSVYHRQGIGIQENVRPCYTPAGLEGRSGVSRGALQKGTRFLPCKTRND